LIPPVDDEVLPFDVAEVTKAPPEGLRRLFVRRVEVQQDADPRRRLPRRLRLREELRGEEAASQSADERPAVNHSRSSSRWAVGVRFTPGIWVFEEPGSEP
jgi:hypothetical protein